MLTRWAMSMQDLDLDIKYCSGKTSVNADALSRNHNEPGQSASNQKQEALSLKYQPNPLIMMQEI